MVVGWIFGNFSKSATKRISDLPTLPVCKPVVPYAGIIIINGDNLLAQMSNNGKILQGPTSGPRLKGEEKRMKTLSQLASSIGEVTHLYLYIE